MYANVVIVRFLQFPQTPRKKGGMQTISECLVLQSDERNS